MENNWNKYWFEFILKHPDKVNWAFISSNRNLTLEWIENYPDKPWHWGEDGISSNPNLTLDIIEKYPDKPWYWGQWGISENRSLTFDIIEKFPDKEWYWGGGYK